MERAVPHSELVMNRNVKIRGTNYNDIPHIELPLQTSGTASFFDVSDTTRTAEDVATGKYFYNASGIRTLGTSSGGGGASNLVTGTFTTSNTVGYYNINVPYTGTGYPLMIVVVVETGAYHSGTTWYSSAQRYAVGQWTCTKANFETAPSYTTGSANNQGVTTWLYKNTSSTSYSRSSAMSTNVFSSSNSSGRGATCVRYKSGNVLSYYVNTTSYGLLPEETYRYFIVYSD